MKKRCLIFAALLLTVGVSYGQSIFKPVPKVRVTHYTMGKYGITPVAGPDSAINAVRPVVGVAAFSEPGNQLMTGAGLGYQHLKWNYGTAKWEAEYSVSLLGWAAGSVSPGPQIPAFAAGPVVGFFNNLVLLGGARDFTHKQWIGVLSLGISLNN